jgi:hypothetical protein
LFYCQRIDIAINVSGYLLETDDDDDDDDDDDLTNNEDSMIDSG